MVGETQSKEFTGNLFKTISLENFKSISEMSLSRVSWDLILPLNGFEVTGKLP